MAQSVHDVPSNSNIIYSMTSAVCDTPGVNSDMASSTACELPSVNNTDCPRLINSLCEGQVANNSPIFPPIGLAPGIDSRVEYPSGLPIANVSYDTSVTSHPIVSTVCHIPSVQQTESVTVGDYGTRFSREEPLSK